MKREDRLVSFVWLNQTDQIDQMNQINSRVSLVPPVSLGYPAGVLFCCVTHKPSEFAGFSLRILSSINHNGQRLTLQGFSHRKDLA